MSPENCLGHPLLCKGSGHDGTHGTKCNCCRTNKATVKTMGKCIQLLDYLASNSEAKVRYYVSDMIMNIHLDAS